MPSWATCNASFLLTACLGALAGCGGSSAPPPQGEVTALAHLPRARISAAGRPVDVWIAATPEDRAAGLMGIEAAALQPLLDGTPRGMLFVFPVEAPTSFWMRGTPTALDLAYARHDGSVTTTHALIPYDLTLVPSGQAVGYALEMHTGSFAVLGLAAGSHLDVPASVLAGATP